jgi:hypothetical protein
MAKRRNHRGPNEAGRVVSMSYDLADYVDVKTRIELFYEKFPDGSIQFEYMGVMDGNPEYIWGIARAYRNPEDPRPFVGTCSELAQGKTPFTRGSELANLETSAIGRAIGAAGLGLGKSMATAQEVTAAQARQVDEPAPEYFPARAKAVNGQPFPIPQMTKKQSDFILKLANGQIHLIEEWKASKSIKGTLNIDQAKQLIDYLKTMPMDDPWALEIPKGGHDE